VLTGVARGIGAAATFAPVDEALLKHVTRLTGTPMAFSPMWTPDPDASYEKVVSIDISTELREPQVRCYGRMEGVFPLSQVVDKRVHLAVIGSCSNGRSEDLAAAADVLTGRRVHAGTRLLVIPASQQIYLDASRHGYLQVLAAAGAVHHPPGCGAMTNTRHGKHAAGEACMSATSCSFYPGKSWTRQEIYEANPALVAAAAAAGRIVHPDDVVEEAVA
ncbi:MAG: aconitase family protein, partial [Acidobacteria bacterium]|nr:aconitase family protein [Acidobacteriota bacterium]